MDTSFDELKNIMDRVYSGSAITQAEFHDQIVTLLANHGTGLRQDNGINPEVTISHPTSLPGSMVVGLRYTKNDGTKTEDHFLFQPGQPIQRHYKGNLEEVLLEYKDTHKLQR